MSARLLGDLKYSDVSFMEVGSIPFLRITFPSLAFNTAYVSAKTDGYRVAIDYLPQKPLSRPMEKQDLSSLNVTERTLLGCEGWIL